MTWREELHPRDPATGEFAWKDWAGRISAVIGRATDVLDIVEDDIPALMQRVPSDAGVRGQYIRRAMQDKVDMPDSTTLLVSRDRAGNPVGALSLVDYPSRDHPHMVIQSLGALEGSGAANKLVAGAAAHALNHNREALYTEPTQNALSFWQHKGFTEDPLEVGSYYHGVTPDEMWGLI